MKTNKLTLLTVATIATATLGIKGVNADESDRGITPENTTVTTNQSGEASRTESAIPTTEANQPTNSNNDAGAGSAEAENKGGEGLPTNITKDGDQIRVENPKVVVEQPEGNGRYTPFKVKYEDIKIPDNIEVNEGDKVTVFNDYFKSHPLNKSMNLELDASWSDKVVAGKPVNVNFNGTVVTANVGSEGVIGKDELITKWGSQDKEDPTVINWTARVNYARRLLNHVTIIDEMSENQKLVDNYFEIKNIESLDPWIDKGSAMDLVKSISKKDHGFEITMDRLDHMIYLYYKTKLVNAVKDSTNPTNKIELKAEDAGSVMYQKIQLVGGKGDAVGENKPVWEIPNDAPKYDKPSININDIPLMPPAPKETPKVEEVKIVKSSEKSNENHANNESEETVEAYSAPATLPNTGSDFGIAISLLGIIGLSLGVYALKKN